MRALRITDDEHTRTRTLTSVQTTNAGVSLKSESDVSQIDALELALCYVNIH